VGVFIGESDRLNSYLDIRLGEYDALRALGRVPNWDYSMFGGFSLAALHWMSPGNDPIAWYLQLFARQDVFWALGFVAIFLVAAACLSAYLYIRELVGDGLITACAAVCYGLSVFSVHRICQVDTAHLTIVLLPLAMLAVRKVAPHRMVGPFVGLCAVLTALAQWGFLQEVAYTFCFVGAYAVYRSAIRWREGWLTAVAPVIVFGTATFIAILFASPRLITVGLEFGQLTRTTFLNYYGYIELLRFFHEGIYGRYYDEGRSLGHAMNLHEGLQLVSSSMLSLFVIIGIARPSRRIEVVGALMLAALLLALIPFGVSLPLIGGALSASSNNVLLCLLSLLFVASVVVWTEPYLGLSAGLRNIVSASERPPDTSFLLFTVVVLLTSILTFEGYSLVSWAFFGVDFSHTRLSVLIILPLCSLFAVYLSELWARRTDQSDVVHTSNTAALVSAAVLAALGALFLHGSLLDHLVPANSFKAVYQSPLLPLALVKLALTGVVLIAMFGLLLWPRRARGVDLRRAAIVVIAVFAAAESTAYAHLKIAGPQTWTFPAAFYNYLNVPPPVLRPPSSERLAEFSRQLETKAYRSVLIPGSTGLIVTKSPHIAEFWQVRLIGGYGTGVAKRLADLPWAPSIRGTRTIELGSVQDFDPALMALLNVKYIISASTDLYFDVAGQSAPNPGSTATSSEKSANVDGVRFDVAVNSMTPLPRYYLAPAITGVSATPRLAAANAPAPSTSDAAIIHDVSGLRDNALVEGLSGIKEYDAQGDLRVSYSGDLIDVRVSPSNRTRFVVLNERYHPDWRAYANGSEIPVHPTNAVMMGFEVPAGVTNIEFRFVPFSSRDAAWWLRFAAIIGFGLALASLRHLAIMARRVLPTSDAT
jgi:hypothetical protein